MTGMEELTEEEIDTGQDLISPVPINGRVVPIPGNLVNAETVHILGGIENGQTPANQGNDEIAHAEMPSRFAWPPFNSYDGKRDPIEHVSHYIQMMSLHTHNDALMCKVLPSSLGPTALRWFDGLQKGSIHSFSELIQEFGVQFMTCSCVPQSVDTLLSMKMRVRETLRSYASRYWELYNEIGGDNENVAVSIFIMGLLEDSELWESLTKKPLEDMRQLMRCIEE
ncbi:uncharacterized protein LOC112033870 [Quercus suber]|uniref:uncharacterized protein LOC112033870 n=1 Tax=Quercus suber TaxID=58331 RepID=UPI0032DF763E